MKFGSILKVVLVILFVTFSSISCDLISTTRFPDIEITKGDSTMKAGERLFLGAALNLEGCQAPPTISWTSSDPDIIMIDGNGVIIALKEGKSMITATREDTFVSDTVQVTVAGISEVEFTGISPKDGYYQFYFEFRNDELVLSDNLYAKVEIRDGEDQIITTLIVVSSDTIWLVRLSPEDSYYLGFIKIPNTVFLNTDIHDCSFDASIYIDDVMSQNIKFDVNP